MPDEGRIDSPKNKDPWEKADVISKLVASSITAVAACLVAYYGSIISSALEEKKIQATYTDLLSRREEADATLRKDMFQPIIDSFLDPKSQDAPLDRKVLNLEMLTRNFHDSLNLKPLFLTLLDDIDEFHDAKRHDAKRKERYLARVDEVARDTARKQMLVLEQHGKKYSEMIDLKSLANEPQEIQWTATLDQIKRRFRIVVLDSDPKRKRLTVSLQVTDLNEGSATFGQTTHQDLLVGFFDFPMIDNVRLSDDERCAVVLSQFTEPVAEIEIVYFSGDYASVRDKAFFPEVIGKLLREKRR